MIDRELTGLFATLDHEPEPPLPPGQLEQIVTLGRRKARKHRLTKAAALIVMTLTLGLAGYVLPGQLPTGLSGAGDEVVLPDRLAGYRIFTADASHHPAGKALLLFNSGSYELFYTSQTLAVGVDGRSYRQIGALSQWGGKHALLSPDGGALMIAEGQRPTTVFTYIDLKTGRSHEIPLTTPAGVTLHAWSPDGRYVAYGQVPWSGAEASNALQLAVGKHGALTILNLSNGTSTIVPDMAPAAAASFAPGGEQIAVQRGTTTWVVNVDGSRPREIYRPPGSDLGIVPGSAWSPDGRLLAMIPWRLNGDTMEPMYALRNWIGNETIGFVDATGAGRSAPEPVTAGDMLGWRTPRSVVALDRQTRRIVEVSLDDGRSRTLSTFERPHTCELGTQPCGLEDVQVATGLLAAMTVKPAQDPLRGPWPLWLQLVFAAATVFIGLIVYRIVRRVRRRALAGAWRSANPDPAATPPESPRT